MIVSVYLSSGTLISFTGYLLSSTAAVQKITGQEIFWLCYLGKIHGFKEFKRWDDQMTVTIKMIPEACHLGGSVLLAVHFSILYTVVSDELEVENLH